MYTQCMMSGRSRSTIGFTCEFVWLIQCPALTRIYLSAGRSTARLNNDRPLPSSTVRFVEQRKEMWINQWIFREVIDMSIGCLVFLTHSVE